jgi:hypothetical protein
MKLLSVVVSHVSESRHGATRVLVLLGWRLFVDFAFASGVAAFAGDLGGIFVVFAISAAIFFVGHAGTGGMGAFLHISH